MISRRKKECRNSRLCVWRPQDWKMLERVGYYFDLMKLGVLLEMFVSKRQFPGTHIPQEVIPHCLRTYGTLTMEKNTVFPTVKFYLSVSLAHRHNQAMVAWHQQKPNHSNYWQETSSRTTAACWVLTAQAKTATTAQQPLTTSYIWVLIQVNAPHLYSLSVSPKCQAAVMRTKLMLLQAKERERRKAELNKNHILSPQFLHGLGGQCCLQLTLLAGWWKKGLAARSWWAPAQGHSGLPAAGKGH